MALNSCCIFINNDNCDQVIFINALRDAAPQTLCLTFNNAEDAISIMVEEMIVPSFILIEFDLVKMNGGFFLDVIRGIDLLKDVPVVVHAISPKANEIIELKESGALAIYFRPYDHFGICNLIGLYFSADAPTICSN